MDPAASSARVRRSVRGTIACGIAALAMTQLPAVEPLTRRPGAQADGSVVLPNQWSLRPVGRQTVVGDVPVAIALHPDGETAVVLHCGYGPHELAVIDTKTRAVLSRTRVAEAFQGLAFSPQGDRLHVSGGGAESILVYRCESRALVPARSLAIRDAAVRGIPCGMAISSDGRTLYVANVWGHTVSRIQLPDADGEPDVTDLLLSDTPPTPAPAKPATTDDPSITKRADALLERIVADAPHPWTCTLDEPRKRLSVSLWAQAAVAVIDTRTWRTIGRIEVEEHPNEMLLAPDGRRLFVANANRNSVSVIDLTQELAVAKVTETLVATLTPDAAPGNTPNSLAISADGSRLYVESEVSADGHEWTMGAYATDFVERNWPLAYGHNKKSPYPAEGAFAAARPAGGYLWDRAAAAGVSFRSYGEWVTNGKTPADPCTARVQELEGRIDPFFRGFDQNYSDLKRADRFIAELARFEKEGEMPRLRVMRLPNDHTSGTSPGHLTPTAFMAENDLAFGRVVEAVSRSRFWPTTAIFVVEDDAQNGPDHIDAHRTIAFVISPWARHGAVDSSLYSTSSMLRTMELILGLEPMSQFDAAALPMIRSFAKAPVNEPYACRPAGVSLDERNVATAWGARESLAMDLSVEDAADDLLFNEIIWRSVRGPEARMPAPRRAAFVFSGGDDDEDDDDDAPREERD